jgi:hypothetical protein
LHLSLARWLFVQSVMHNVDAWKGFESVKDSSTLTGNAFAIWPP